MSEAGSRKLAGYTFGFRANSLVDGLILLGTFIVEWDEGKKLAKQLLLTKESAQMYAERLTELAVALNFDGWLLNMEVTLDPKQIPNLKEFVDHLSQTMHSAVPGYDSVTIDGDLSWQDQLNDKNKPFFDLCDGIFVNYTWKEDYPKLSADVAGDRKFDVYMGIDVFGRGTYGGGQWTTNVALDVIKKDGVSAAIFAPGWVYETNQPPDFQTAQNRFANLFVSGDGEAEVLLFLPSQEVPQMTDSIDDSLLADNGTFSFGLYKVTLARLAKGHGYHIYVDGEQVLDTPWNNISSQSFQPFIEYPGDPSTQPIQVVIK
ncbi:Cytosolic endo-beta-N-acetylglucosaminidase 2 [Forsythia ovata]|uniref:Cytosolic endo-beta-N-acetylglucosaminidase 2 n=1 Tax=Forsythia ovata TaxID=205694 RepID=A0ABD1TU44_9LAMI